MSSFKAFLKELLPLLYFHTSKNNEALFEMRQALKEKFSKREGQI